MGIQSAKPRYTNEGHRKAEAARRQARDPELMEHETRLMALSTSKLNLELAKSQVEARVRALLAVKDIMVAKAGVLTALLELAAPVQITVEKHDMTRHN